MSDLRREGLGRRGLGVRVRSSLAQTTLVRRNVVLGNEGFDMFERFDRRIVVKPRSLADSKTSWLGLIEVEIAVIWLRRLRFS